MCKFSHLDTLKDFVLTTLEREGDGGHHQGVDDDTNVLAYLCEIYITKKSTQHQLMTTSFAEIEEYTKAKYKHVHLGDIYNCVKRNWYCGNMLDFICFLILQPSLYFFQQNVTLTRQFVQSCIVQMYILVSRFNVSTRISQSLLSDFQFSAKVIHIDYDQFIQLRLLVKHGSSIRTILRDLVLIKVTKMRKKKKNAVRAIETWWFDIINNPFSVPGKRMLQKRSDIYNKKYGIYIPP